MASADRERSSSVLENENIVQLNVGGTVFLTTKDTLLVDTASYFSSLLNGRYRPDVDSFGKPCYFIDRDPTHFRHILNFLRGQGSAPSVTSMEELEKLEELLCEAEFYQVRGLVSELKKQIDKIRERPEKEYKMFSNVDASGVDDLFQEWVRLNGWDFESWLQTKDGGINIVFSRLVSREDLRLVNRLMKHT